MTGRKTKDAMLTPRRLLLLFVFLAAVAPLLAALGAAPATTETFTGKVETLGDVVARAGGRVDVDAAGALVLTTDDGKHYLLVKDAGCRLFFKDKALLRRPMRLSGRLLGGGLLQVSVVRSLVGGEVCEVYYWCDVCSIKRGEKMICECCGGPMVLREEPVKK
jgi:hypothetical protein